jgi:VanZ family protein
MLRLLIDERTKRVLFSLWCLGWAAVLLASLRPMLEMPFDLSDTLLHFSGYALMTAGVAGFCHSRREVARWALFAILMGGLIEIAQGFVPTRSTDARDFLTNSAGVATGAAVALLWLTAVIEPLRRRRGAVGPAAGRLAKAGQDG